MCTKISEAVSGLELSINIGESLLIVCVCVCVCVFGGGGGGLPVLRGCVCVYNDHVDWCRCPASDSYMNYLSVRITSIADVTNPYPLDIPGVEGCTHLLRLFYFEGGEGASWMAHVCTCSVLYQPATS